MRIKILAGLTLTLAFAAPAIAHGLTPKQQAEASAIEGRVNCLCGCLTTLKRCPHPNCSMKAEEDGLIVADIEAGKSQAKTIQDLVLKYGVKILPSPPARGFNLTAWILPGIGLLAGLWVVIALARKWRSGPARAEVPAPADQKLLTDVETEMRHVIGERPKMQ